MSDHIDTRDGWREVRPRDIANLPPGSEYLQRVQVPAGNVTGYWVREEPVPPLPTELHTSIRVDWNLETLDGVAEPDDREFVLRTTGATGVLGLRWWRKHGPYLPEWLSANITGFEVLSVPLPVLLPEEKRDPTFSSWKQLYEMARSQFPEIQREAGLAVIQKLRAQSPTRMQGDWLDQVQAEIEARR